MQGDKENTQFHKPSYDLGEAAGNAKGEKKALKHALVGAIALVAVLKIFEKKPYY